jgi:ABC-2 type transport system ATP-binding protein
MADEPAIKISNISKDFVLPHEKHSSSIKGVVTGLARHHDKGSETQHALRDISFEINKGEFFGIVGRNGSGKSTLLKILAGIYQPTKGSVSVQGKIVPFIELGVGFNGELSGRENVYLNGAMLGFSEKEVDAMYEDIVAFAELERFMDQKLKNYSSGMQVRLAFSMATRAQADVLLVDEVLAVGDESFQKKCFDYFRELKARNKTVIFVTHDMNAVREYCERAVLIDNSEIKAIGSAKEVSREYSLLFVDESRSPNAKKGNGRRWGNGDVKITSSEADLVGDDIIIKAKVHINKPVDKLVYGLNLIGEDGGEIVALNNRMIQAPDIDEPKVGSDIEFTWKMLNVFNEGSYYVMLTFIDDAATPLDWFVRAASFTVKREKKSATAILPPIDVTSKVSK